MLSKIIKVIIITVITCLDGLLYTGILWAIFTLLSGHFYINTFIMTLIFIHCLGTSVKLLNNLEFKITKIEPKQQ